jgi:hypothetical protein
VALETVDLKAIPVMAAGGPYRGVGSPPEGDYYSVADLEQFARDTNELIEQIDPPAKIGHSFGQRMLRSSGISDDEKPAVGWLRNLRVEGEKLLADITKVPKKFAQLVEAGAFRKRSPEIAILRRQGTSDDARRYKVIRGLAWLGAKAPAIRTLDEIAALYSEDTDEAERFLAEEQDEPSWNPNQGYRWIQERIYSALNNANTTYYVADVGPSEALVLNTASSTTMTGHIVPFTISEETVYIAPPDEWIAAAPPWIRVALTYRDFVEPASLEESRAAADTKSVEKFELSDEQVAQFAETLGVDAETLDPETLLSSVGELKQRAEQPPPVEDKEEEEEGVRKMSEEEFVELKTDAEAGKEAKRELWEMRRKAFLDAAEEAGKIVPAARESYEKMYAADENETRTIIEALPQNEVLLREYGSDDNGLGEDAKVEERLFAAFQAYRGNAPEPEAED